MGAAEPFMSSLSSPLAIHPQLTPSHVLLKFNTNPSSGGEFALIPKIGLAATEFGRKNALGTMSHVSGLDNTPDC